MVKVVVVVVAAAAAAANCTTGYILTWGYNTLCIPPSPPSTPPLVVLRSNDAILFNLALVYIAQRRYHFECGRWGRGSEAFDNVVLVGNDA